MKKIFIAFMLVFGFLVFSNVQAYYMPNDNNIPKDYIEIYIDDYDEISNVYGWNGTTSTEIDDFSEYFEFQDDSLTILKSANYEIHNNLYGLEVMQNTDQVIGFNIWSNGDLLLKNIKSQGYSITVNGELEVKDSAIYLAGVNDPVEGSINAEEDIIIDNSIITCENAFGAVSSSSNTASGNIHSYYGDIIIKNDSDVEVEGRIYVEEGSITISDSKVVLDEEWGYMEAATDIKILNSNISFLFGIQGSENIEIKDSTITALNKNSLYAQQANQNNQGWIQATSGSITINNSKVNVINSITSDTNMDIKDSQIVLSGDYSNNGYLQSGEGNISINNSSVTADKDIYAKQDIDVKDSKIVITGNLSKKGYLEAHDGSMKIENSSVEVDEGIVSDKNTTFLNSEFNVAGKNSKRGYVQVFNGSLDVKESKIKINEKATINGKTTFNNSFVSLLSGIVSNGIDIIDSNFYASNHDTSLELSSYSPVISLDKILIKNSEFISESSNDIASIASLGEIKVIDNGFINKSNDALDVIKVRADSSNFVNGKNSDYFKDGDIVYTTSLDNKISNYSTLKSKIVNPETFRNVASVAITLGVLFGTLLVIKKREVKDK